MKDKGSERQITNPKGDKVRWKEMWYYTLVLHFCILQCLCPRPLSTNYLLFLQPRGPWPPTVLQHSHSQCISGDYPLQKTEQVFRQESLSAHCHHQRLTNTGKLDIHAMVVILKVERLSKCGSSNPICSEDQNPFLKYQKFKWSCFEYTLWQEWGFCDCQAIGKGDVLRFWSQNCSLYSVSEKWWLELRKARLGFYQYSI